MKANIVKRNSLYQQFVRKNFLNGILFFHYLSPLSQNRISLPIGNNGNQ